MSFAALPLEELLADNTAWIDRIRLCYGTDRPHFEHDVLRVIRCLAAYVHQLPANPTEAFSEAGGLLQLSLQTAFYNLQGSDGQIFSGQASVVARRHLEPRWRLATLIAGLCAETYRPLSQMRVSIVSGAHWPAALLPLLPWLEQQQATHYDLHWQPGGPPQRGLTLFALPHLVPADLVHYLADANNVIIPHLLASLSGVPLHGETNVIDTLVRRAHTLVMEREQATYAGRHGALPSDAPLQQALLQALRQLLQHNPAWRPNAPKSRIWWGIDGMFMVWPDAAPELHQQLAALLTPSLPVRAEALLPLLLEAGLVQAHTEDDALWTISPPGRATPIRALNMIALQREFETLPPDSVPLNHTLIWARPSTTPQLALALYADDLPDSEPPQPTLTLNAPLRLNLAVRRALTNILSALSDTPTTTHARPVSEGLFVPLTTLEHQGLQAATALRALSEVDMLIGSMHNTVPTHTRDIDGTAITGVILAPIFITGLEPIAAAPEQAS